MSALQSEPTRRAFIRALGADAVTAARTVYGVGGLARNLVGEIAGAIDPTPDIDVGPGAAATTSSSVAEAFCIRDDRITILDQRVWPDNAEYECRHGADVARALRNLVVCGPVIGVIAAYGLAFTARRVQEASADIRRGTLKGAAFLLRSARPSSGDLDNAIERLEACWPDDATDSSGTAEANFALATAAELMAAAMDAEERLCAIGAAGLPPTPGRALQVMMLGSTGAMSGAGRGTALGIARVAREMGRDIHLWLLETRPWPQMARIAMSELQAAGIHATLIADASAGAVMSRDSVDVVLVGAERVAMTGDLVGTVGTYPVAVLAARHHVPLWVAIPTSTISTRFVEGRRLPLEDRLPADLTRSGIWPTVLPAPDAFVPLVDETPASLVTTYVTERGLISPPFLFNEPMRP